jgi:hypothetical protein
VNKPKYLTTFKWHGCKAHTESLHKNDEPGERCVSRNYDLCLTCIDKRCKQRHQECTVSVNIIRLPTNEPEGNKRQVYWKRKKERK